MNFFKKSISFFIILLCISFFGCTLFAADEIYDEGIRYVGNNINIVKAKSYNDCLDSTNVLDSNFIYHGLDVRQNACGINDVYKQDYCSSHSKSDIKNKIQAKLSITEEVDGLQVKGFTLGASKSFSISDSMIQDIISTNFSVGVQLHMQKKNNI